MNSTSSQANPYAPPRAEVRDTATQEEGELAGRGERFGAAILDSIIAGLFVAPLFIGANFQALAAKDYANAFSPVGLGIAALGSLALLVFTAYLVHKNGQTIGKKIVGIKVVRTDFSRASLSRIFWLRNVVNAIPGVIPFIGNFYSLVDHLFIFGERRQCLHDKIASTLVVKA
ncbi:MAG TPA: RDD family protein [Steroidobacter sp.]|uniref:RDD family protein n=1 Tax=Steroidobacter sp. TaxID=1978227 RepID=UPI002ED884DE